MEVIIAPILSIVSVLCSCSANNSCCYLLDLQENKEDLNNALVELRATRDGVKTRVDEAENNPNQERTPEVDSWLKRAQIIDDEVVQVIQKADQEIQGRCFGDTFPKNCWTARKIGKLVIRKLATVKDHRSNGSFGDVSNKLLPPLVQEEPTNKTVGMESMFDEVWSLLAQDEIRIMGLYGQGGVGKTTLLKQINNAFLKTTTTTTSSSSRLHGFDVVILVVVSKEVNIKDIEKEIVSRLGLSSTKSTSIFNALIKKNFVLLLDDIWERVDLQSIGIPHSPDNKKSKVVFTTRSETVCGHMEADTKFRVECLPWDKAWTLFQEKVGNETLNSFPGVRELAKDVARECGGLPLALITIGRAMSTKKTTQEWKHAITTLQRAAAEFPGMGKAVFPKGEAVFPLLKVSYDSLVDNTIKSCFLYCALFPEDQSIDISKLVDYWIGEGFISLDDFGHIDEARNYGYHIIGDLKGACLLESSDEETHVKMHDTIRDMALWITRECGSSKSDKMLIIKRYDPTADRSWYNAERIYMMQFCIEFNTEVPTLKSPNLLTLIFGTTTSKYILPQNFSESTQVPPLKRPYFFTMIIGPSRDKLPQNFFEYMPHLRVLDLTSAIGLDTFPISITELLELRYLSLSKTEIKELPEELGKLVKLNFLDLSSMKYLEKFPSGVIGSLSELRFLNLFESRVEVDWDIEEVYKLKHLNDFGININTEHSDLTKLLSFSNQNLQRYTRRLSLTQRCTRCLSTLSPIIKLLQLLSNLETLSLDSIHEAELLLNMMGIELHHHLGKRSSCFQNLRDISIQKCNSLKSLTWVGYVPNLKTLFVAHCEELEEIVVVDDLGGGSTGGGDGIISSKNDEMMNNVQDIFKSLETLQLRNLPKLKRICRNALVFPCLKTMRVYKCPELKKLPLDSRSNVNNTLQKIQGEEEWWNELQWEAVVKSKFLHLFGVFRG